MHATQEWHDLYQQETNDELQQFLDRYTKGKDNSWELTPRVRVSILRYNKVMHLLRMVSTLSYLD